MTLRANKFEEESAPSDPRWPYLRGVALVGKSPDEAIPCLRRAVAVCQDRCAEAHLRLAETLAANGHAAEAETHFREVPAGYLTPCAGYGLGVLAALGELPAGKRWKLPADPPWADAFLIQEPGEVVAGPTVRQGAFRCRSDHFTGSFLRGGN